MADTAAHLVDNVLPRVPIRQWVLSVPRVYRYYLARDASLLTRALRIFVSEIFRHYRRKLGVKRAQDGQGGALTAVQRFGAFLNLNCHLHDLVLDGLFVRNPRTGALGFRRARPPTSEDLEDVLNRTRLRLIRYLERKGFEVGDYSLRDPREEGEGPGVQEIFQAASIRERIAIEGDGRPVPMEGREEGRLRERPDKPFSFDSGDGWSIEAGVRIRAGDRKALERLCRYVLRPPFAQERLFDLEDGRYQYLFRRTRPDGAESMTLTGVQLLEKLSALVPPPRSHLLRYHGVLAPHAKARPRVVPPEEPPPRREVAELPRRRRRRKRDREVGPPRRPRRGRRRRTPWAELLRRTFGYDVLECPRCKGRMEVLACITNAASVRRILRALGLPEEPPRAAPARSPPQLRFDFAQDSSQAV